MQVAVLCGDRWHPAEVVMNGLNALGNEHIQFDYITGDADWSQSSMNRYEAVVLAKSNRRSPEDPTPWLTADMQRAFVEYVEGGGALVLLHAGTVGFGSEPVFLELAGGVFTGHPEPCPVTLRFMPDNPLFANQPEPVGLFDEHYFIRMSGDDAHVFMTSESEHGIQPAGWTRRQGSGKVCVLTPGHYEDVWLQPVYAAAITAALEWASDTSG